MKPYDSPITITLEEYINLLFDSRHQLLTKSDFCCITTQQKSTIEKAEGFNVFVVITKLDNDITLNLRSIGVISKSEDEVYYKLQRIDTWRRQMELEIQKKMADDIKRQSLIIREQRINKALGDLVQQMNISYDMARELMFNHILRPNKLGMNWDLVAQKLGISDLVEK